MRTLKLTSPLMRGDDVKKAQGMLNNRGFWAGRLDGVFGEQTARACAQAKWVLGYAEKDCTQTYGNLLHSFLTNARKPTFMMKRRAKKRASVTNYGEQALTEALKWVGTKEDPPNSNRVIFSNWYGLIGPWCAMFVTYCFVQAKSKSFIRGARWAYCPFMVNDARAQRNGLTVVPKDKVQPGDIAMFDWQGDGISDHVGIVYTPVTTRGNFKCVEGNTSYANDSNGGMVMIRDRNAKQVLVFIRVVE